MPISIRHLPKHKVFMVLHNYRLRENETITEDEAKKIITHCNSQNSTPPIYKFDQINVENILYKTSDRIKFPILLKIDITSNLLDTEEYNALKGRGAAERIIHSLRLQYLDQLAPENVAVEKNIIEELKFDIQMYNQIFEYRHTIKTLKDKVNYLSSSEVSGFSQTSLPANFFNPCNNRSNSEQKILADSEVVSARIP